MKEFYTYRLPNGIRGIHRQVKGGVMRAALCINAGTRDELKSEYGLAHFTEHGFFKGTKRRKAYQVNCRLENLGGELNAFTTKEDTTIHATILRSDFSKAVELISDIAFNSTFPDREIEKEREVIFDEINTYKDSPADLIYDSFEDMLFADSELGHNILGRKQNLKLYNSQSCHNFLKRTHTTDQMVFSTIGNLSAKSVEERVARYFGDVEASVRGFDRIAPALTPSFNKEITKHTHQTHCIIGSRAYGIEEKKKLPLSLAVNILGGPCANSRLNMTVREKYGLSYTIEANYTPYGDSGIVAIYYSSDHYNSERCSELIYGELKRISNVKLTTRQLSMAKKQFIAQLAISMEANEGYMLGVGKSFLCHREVDTLEEVYRKVNMLTASEIMDAANEIFSETSRLVYR